jgi:hypothetical protein
VAIRTRLVAALTAAVALADLAGWTSTAQAQEQARHGRAASQHRKVAQSDAYAGDRPLTINPRRRHYFGPLGQGNNGPVVQIGPNEIYAPGGFKLPGRPLTFAERQEFRKEARNAFIREATSGIYGYGLDGLGGTGFSTLNSGYNNPSYGNSFNRYIGYNGVPSNFAFGPSYAFRYVTDHDPEDDDDERGHPPGQTNGDDNPFDIDN